MSAPGTNPMPAGPLAVGAQFGEGGRYALKRLLGTGGMASVWAATDARLHREVAIKIISDTLALDPDFVARFDREARIVAGISHPHVVQVFDYDARGLRPYLVMEYVSGGTLAARLQDGRADWDPLTLAREILDALAHIHAAGVLHRDLKPANVLLAGDGRARLTDFGIAHLVDATRLTSTGLVIGTQRYLDPDVLAGAPATAGSDLYSCGVLLAECAGPDAPEPLGALITALTDPVAARRPASAHEALASLGQRRRADPTSTQPLPTVIEAPPTVRVNARTRSMTVISGSPTGARRTLALAAAVAAIALTVVLGVVRGGGGPDPLVVPAPGGSITQQLDQLDDAVDRARN